MTFPTEGGKVPASQNKASEQPPLEEKKKTKEEALRDDIEMGLELLNSIFG